MCYQEESLQEKGELVARVLLALAEVVAVVQQVRVQPDLETKAEGVFKTPHLPTTRGSASPPPPASPCTPCAQP